MKIQIDYNNGSLVLRSLGINKKINGERCNIKRKF